MKCELCNDTGLYLLPPYYPKSAMILCKCPLGGFKKMLMDQRPFVKKIQLAIVKAKKK